MLHRAADIATANSVKLSGTLDIAHFQAASLKSIFIDIHVESSALSLVGTGTRHSFRCWLRGIKHRLLPCRDRSLLGKWKATE